MSTKPKKYSHLTRLDGATHPVRLRDVVTLLHNLMAGALDEDVGHEDADKTIDDIVSPLNRKTPVTLAAIESCLWSCNMLDEKQKFWDSNGRTFDQFVKDVLSPYKFDKIYNTIEKRKK